VIARIVIAKKKNQQRGLMMNKLKVMKYLPAIVSLVSEVINAKKDGKISNEEKSKIMKKFWVILKIK